MTANKTPLVYASKAAIRSQRSAPRLKPLILLAPQSERSSKECGWFLTNASSLNRRFPPRDHVILVVLPALYACFSGRQTLLCGAHRPELHWYEPETVPVGEAVR